MVGNDVVDLGDPEARPGANHPGRVCASVREQAAGPCDQGVALGIGVKADVAQAGM